MNTPSDIPVERATHIPTEADRILDEFRQVNIECGDMLMNTNACPIETGNKLRQANELGESLRRARKNSEHPNRNGRRMLQSVLVRVMPSLGYGD